MRNHHAAFFALCVTAGLSQASVAVVPSCADNPTAQEGTGEDAPIYEAMIDALANRNAAPERIKLRKAATAHVMSWFDRQPLFPAAYDWDE
jgi:hypothetical protein